MPGNYVVRLFDVDGCTYELPVTMDNFTLPVLDVSADTTICLGGAAQLGASSVDDPLNLWTYTWADVSSDFPVPVPNGSSPIVSPVEMSLTRSTRQIRMDVRRLQPPSTSRSILHSRRHCSLRQNFALVKRPIWMDRDQGRF